MAGRFAASLLANHTHFGRKAIRLLGRPRSVNDSIVTTLHGLQNIGASLAKPQDASSSVFGAFLGSVRGSLRISEFSSEAEEAPSDEQKVDFTGVRVQYSSEMTFMPESLNETIPCFRFLRENGQPISPSYVAEVQFDRQLCLNMYTRMVTLQLMDTIFYEAQRQGRISFYVTSIGEEGINVASAAALDPSDVVLSQYREAGVLLWRGFTLNQFADQCFGNDADLGKGRQMPVHYGCKDLNFFTVSSPIATQIPQAVGVAYSLKMSKENACAVTYFGDGGTSEGDFHAAMNFAAVLEVPLLFICRNNGWAISTPTTEQFRSDGVAVKGQAYGMRSLRVDGNDALAVYLAIKTAREMAVADSRPILIEALTYRVGHHSTSDDSSKYRSNDEIEHWRSTRGPIMRLRKWLQSNGWWSDEEEHNLSTNLRGQMMSALQNAELRKKPCLAHLFEDVYDSVPGNLKEQERGLCDIVKKYPKEYPSDISLD